MLIFDEGSPLDKKAFQKFEDLCFFFLDKKPNLSKVFKVENPQLSEAFNSHRATLWGKQNASPSVFKSFHWRSLPDFEQRNSFYLYFNKYVARFRHLNENDGSKVGVFSNSSR